MNSKIYTDVKRRMYAGLFIARSWGAVRDLIGNIYKENNDEQQSGCNLYIGSNSPKIIHRSSSFSSDTVKSKKEIPYAIAAVNVRASYGVAGGLRVGPINAVANHAAEKLLESTENAFHQGLVKITFTPFGVNQENRAVNSTCITLKPKGEIEVIRYVN